jgi:hypothetical protein
MGVVARHEGGDVASEILRASLSSDIRDVRGDRPV